MIVQNLLDLLSEWIAGVLGLIPALPAEFDAAVVAVESGGTLIGALVSPLGALLPFNSMMIVVQWWLASLVFWIAMVGIRAVLWVLGR